MRDSLNRFNVFFIISKIQLNPPKLSGYFFFSILEQYFQNHRRVVKTNEKENLLGNLGYAYQTSVN